MNRQRQVYRGALLHFQHIPTDDAGYEYWSDALLIVEDGRIAEVGPAPALLQKLPANQAVEQFSDALILPGFVDTHIHYPQISMIASHGAQLLDWLNDYTFATELKFADADFAEAQARLFLDELLRNGTTTAMVYGTVHPQSVDAFFRVAKERQLAMIAGKVMMDRNAPQPLCDTPESAYRDSKALIERWHRNGRLRYALTPRFAPTSSPQQLALVGQLRREHSDVYLQSHLSENQGEVAWVKQLFPQARDYLDVYDAFGLVGPRTVYGHGIYLSDPELQRMAEAGANIAFCPTSNLFLGSGLFDLKRTEAAGVSVSLATDVGAGTSFSMLRTMTEAYKVCQLQGQSLCPLKSFYMATLGNARVLELDHEIGSFRQGHQADFLVLDLAATPLLDLRTAQNELRRASNGIGETAGVSPVDRVASRIRSSPGTTQNRSDRSISASLRDLLFALMILGDDRAVQATYIGGQCRHRRNR